MNMEDSIKKIMDMDCRILKKKIVVIFVPIRILKNILWGFFNIQNIRLYILH
jgi:hypothetical protein